MDNIGAFTAFTAGILSFASPCVLPIIPGLLAYVTGADASVNQKADQVRRFDPRRLLPTVFFVLGFSSVFMLLGVGASLAGISLQEHQETIARIGGSLVVFFGLHFTNLMLKEGFQRAWLAILALLVTGHLFEVYDEDLLYVLVGTWAVVQALFLFEAHQFLYQQFHMETKRDKTTYVGAFVIGLTFGAGWSPCIGPILGAVLVMAMNQDSVAYAAGLLGIYSAGLAIPFLLASAFWLGFLQFIRRSGKWFPIIEWIGGVLLITMGLLLVSGNMTLLAGG